MKEKKVPAIRFQGFTDDWEQRKLGEVANVYDGVHQTPIYQDSGIMFLSVENISTLTSNKFISEEAFERDYKNYPEKGDILMTRIGDVGTPNVVETAEKVAFYVSLALLKPKDTDSFFLCNTIRSTGFQKGLRNRTLVTAIPQKINKDEIGKVEFQMPTNPDEPKKIGIYFKILDHLITLHQRKLTKLQLLKKSMLTKMFPKDGARVPEIRFQGFHGDWEQRRLGDESVEIIAGGDADKSQLKSEGIYPVIANALTVNGIVGYYDNYYRVSAPAVTVTGRGDIGHAQARKINFTPVVRLLSIKSYHDVDFLSEAINRHHIILESTGVPQLTVPKLADYKIYFPPTAGEERQLGEYFSELDRLIAFYQRKLSKLQKIKQAMLSKLFV